MDKSKLKYHRNVKRNEVLGFRAWLIHIWNDYEKWHPGIGIDGIRIFGFEWNRWF